MTATFAPQIGTVRELPPEEWHKLLEMPGPYHDAGQVPTAAHNRILVIEEDDGTIAGYWGIFTVVHVEPVYIRPEYRHKVSVTRRLWEGVQQLLIRLRVPGALAIISDADAPVNLPMATKIGFQKVPGSLYYLGLPKPEGS
jgi:hypothetical protein